MSGTAPDPPPDAEAWGLCASCLHHRPITSDRGSRFVQCARARLDARFPKYPAVPVRRCEGHEPSPQKAEPA